LITDQQLVRVPCVETSAKVKIFEGVDFTTGVVFEADAELTVVVVAIVFSTTFSTTGVSTYIIVGFFFI
jgi:hypothetical protein